MIHFEYLNIQQTFKKQLSCYSVAMMNGKDRSEIEKGGKIILPTSALDILTRLHIEYPMLFKLTSKNRSTHCGVLEFVAEEGRCYLPYWMMKNLLVNEGEVITIEYVKIPVASFAKFQPQSTDFLEISNPKAVLENSLRNFATLTKGDVISINYNEKNYELCILETKPKDAVSIIECDMDVDFAPPVGYEEPTYTKKNPTTIKGRPTRTNQTAAKDIKSTPNEGYRLDGKAKKTIDTDRQIDDSVASNNQSKQKHPNNSAQDLNIKRGLPDYEYQFGFLRLNQFINVEEESEMDTNNKNEKTIPTKGFKLKEIGTKNAQSQ